MKYYTLAILILLPLTVSSQSKPFASCKLEHRVEPVVDVDGKLVKEIDLGWYASCKITLDDKVIWHRWLVQAHPASFRETVEAVEKFLSREVPKIVKAYRESGKCLDCQEIMKPKPILELHGRSYQRKEYV